MRTIMIVPILLLLALPAALDAQRRGAPPTRGPVTFAIAVADPSGAPVGNVRVSVSGPVERTTRTERFEKDGYITLEREVSGRGSKPIDVKVTLMPVPLPPIEPVGSLPPQQMDPKMVVLDMPAFIEKNYVGRAPAKTIALGCATGGNSTLIQINEPLAQHAHDDADEFIYVIAGEGMAHFGQRQEPLGPAVFLMIPRRMAHTIAPGKKKPLVMISLRAGEKCGS
jgi:mannose-6-phosphate isomerase-like protein (cupin superfamily)